MSWSVVYAQRSRDLYRALVDALGELAPERGLRPRTILTPSRAHEQALKLAIAEARGVYANLEVSRFPGYARERLEAEHPTARLVGREQLLPLVLRALDDAWLGSEPEAAVLARYLAAAHPGRREVRRLRLAAGLADAWAGYAWSSPRWLEGLRRGRLDPVRLRAVGLGWLPSLARRVLGEDGLLEARAREAGERWLWPEQLGEVLAAPEELFVLGFVQLSPPMLGALRRWAARGQIHLFAPAPTAHAWEEKEDGDLAGLSRLGTAHRVMLTELETLELPTWLDARCDRADEDEGGLADLRRAWLEGRDPTPDEARPGLAIWAAPSARRLLEAVAVDIFERLAAAEQEGTRLALDEIAIHLVEGEAWAELEAVFTEAGALSFRWDAAPLARESVIVRAAEALVGLARTRLRREDLLAVLLSPCCRAARGAHTQAEWAGWAKQAGIYGGADQQDRGEDGPDLRSWDQGLTRLVLGALMRDRAEVALPRGPYVPANSGAELGELGRFVGAVRALLDDVRSLRDRTQGFAAWSQTFEALVERHLEPAEEHDKRALRSVMSALARLRGLEDPGLQVGYVAAAEEALTQLGTLRTGLGPVEGVRVAPLELGEATPRRVAYVLGLAGGRFPRKETPSELDLRRDAIRAEAVLGERHRLDLPREARDRAAVLEVLVETQAHVVLGYVNRDDKGQPVGLAEPIAALARALGVGPIRDIPEARSAGAAPYTSAEPASGGSVYGSHGARLEATLALVRARAEEALGREARPDELARWREDPRVRALLARPEPVPEVEPQKPQRVRLTELLDFLQNPLQGSLKWRARQLEDALEALDAEPEPLELDGLREHDLLLDVIVESSSSPGTPPEALIEALLRRESLEGYGPTGAFQEVNRERLRGLLQKWRGGLNRVGPLRRVALGDGRGPVERLPPLVVTTTRGPLEIVGRLKPISADAWQSFAIVNGKEASGRDRTRLFLEHLALIASGALPPRGATRGRDRRSAVLASRGGGGVEMTSLEVLSPDEARQYLGELTDALVARPHPYWLPMDEALRGGDPDEVLWRLRESLQSKLDAPPEAWDVALDRTRYGVPTIQAWREIFEARYALFLRVMPKREGR